MSTYVAFSGNMQIVYSRVLLVAVTASLLGWILGGRISMQPRDADHHAPTPEQPSSAHCHPHGIQRSAKRAGAHLIALDLLSRSASEFLDMGKYLILAAFAASAVKVFLPWRLVQLFAGAVPLAIAFLMLLAVLLSVCSEADAFVSASFVFFPPAAQLAFMNPNFSSFTAVTGVGLCLTGLAFTLSPTSRPNAWRTFSFSVLGIMILTAGSGVCQPLPV
jgi:uncharacterized membrane protein YraQ (UPF0718 family)